MTTLHSAPYDAETRFGVVMYGGVSLAIYIYGVSQELFELACATPLEGRRVEGGDAAPTREVYRRLSRLASDVKLLQAYALALGGRPPDDAQDVWPAAGQDDGPATRFVIDVIAGTSAGGINGIYLAKALTKAQPFSALGDLWIKDGDIGALLNDGEAYDGLPKGLPRPTGTPASLLSSDRMFMKLYAAFERMRGGGLDPSGAKGSPLVEALDLYVTTTDICGAPVALRLFDKVVYEKRHRQRFHFSYPSRVGDGSDPGYDFAAANHPFLSFAARCTSSFPFAFEPMTLQRVRELLSVQKPQLDSWKVYFDALEPAALVGDEWLHRPYGDGGYLDNKPFSYVVEALSRRFGDPPAQRKLLYVEPDPEPLDPVQGTRVQTPDVAENALGALVGIPLYETIREDLQTVLQRNRRIDRVERIVRLAENDIESRAAKAQPANRFARVRCDGGVITPWAQLSLERMVEYYGESFLPYRRMRVYAVTDWLALQLAAAFDIDPGSDSGYALRAIVRFWREQNFEDNPDPHNPASLPSANAFLNEYDLDYRLRRLTFVLRRIDQLTRLLGETAAGTGAAARSELEQLIAKNIERVFGANSPLQRPELIAPLVGLLRDLKKRLRAVYTALLALRDSWARGAVVSAAVGIDDELRRELTDVLSMLIGQTVPDDRAPPAVRNVDQHKVDLPWTNDWLQSQSVSHDLQDSVMDRVRQWIAASKGQPELLLWHELKRAVASARLGSLGPPVTEVDQLLYANWHLLGCPRLEPEVVQRLTRPGTALPTYEARLHVDPPLTPAGLAIAGTPEAEAALSLRVMLGEYFMSFDSYDQARFTLYYDTATGEPAVVDIVRVSPVDATSLRGTPVTDSRLAGTALAHFGAFLDEHWRRNDIMWGRLDGAERLIHTVLPAADPATARVRAELIRLAHGQILVQTLKRASADELTGRLVAALKEGDSRASLKDRLRQMLEKLKLQASPQREQLADALAALLGADQLRDYVMTQPTFDRRPPTAPTLRNTARALTITGRVLEGVTHKHSPPASPVARWLARVGLLLQGAMVVAVPGTLGQRFGRHVLALLYLFEAMLLLVALIFGGAELRSAATSALVATLALHLLVLVLGDLMRGKRLWWRLAVSLAAALVVSAAGLGVWALSARGLGALCTPKSERLWCEPVVPSDAKAR